MKDKNVLSSPFYKIIQYVYFFLTTNILFLLTNILFFVIFFSVPLLVENVLWYTVALIPAGPAATALFFCMGLLVREQNISPIRDFFRAYRINFLISIKFWLIQLVVMVILGVDILYFFQKGNSLAGIIFIIVLLLVLSITLIGISIVATFEVTLANIYRSTMVSLVRYWKKQLFNMVTIVSFSVLLYAFPSMMFLFIFALTAFYIMRNSQSIFVGMGKRFSQERGKSQ